MSSHYRRLNFRSCFTNVVFNRPLYFFTVYTTRLCEIFARTDTRPDTDNFISVCEWKYIGIYFCVNDFWFFSNWSQLLLHSLLHRLRIVDGEGASAVSSVFFTGEKILILSLKKQEWEIFQTKTNFLVVKQFENKKKCLHVKWLNRVGACLHSFAHVYRLVDCASYVCSY